MRSVNIEDILRFFHPKSFLTLLMLAFAVVLLPMLAALFNAEWALGRLTQKGAGAVYHSVDMTQGSRILVEKIIALERRARQYDVLGDRHLLDEVANTTPKSSRLWAVPALPMTRRRSSAWLAADGERAILRFWGPPPTAPGTKKPCGCSGTQHPGQRDLRRAANRSFGKSKACARPRPRRAAPLLCMLAALIPFTLLVLVGSIRLLSNPVRQIDQAIHRLGEGDFETQVTVTGPDDLVFLGERLDWMRKQLAEVEKTKAMFVAQVSHELKTPLASIREGAELLAEGVVGRLNAQQQEISAILCKSSIHLQKLIENLLGFSKAQASISPLHRSDVRMAELITAVLADHQAVILKKKLRMEVKLEPVTVHGDQARLRTVVDNLLSNAIKYTPPEGRIDLTLQERPGEMVLDVADSGPGVPVAEKGKIFEPFFQGSILAPGPVKGTGLGLSISREFVIAHGGTLKLVDSTARGARFRFTLPLQAKGDLP
jgi:two-component system sensor histidine kinase GlrK